MGCSGQSVSSDFNVEVRAELVPISVLCLNATYVLVFVQTSN